MTTAKNVPVKLASQIMGKSELWIRIGLQRGELPIGTAVQTKKGRWSYYISPKRFQEFTGVNPDAVGD